MDKRDATRGFLQAQISRRRLLAQAAGMVVFGGTAGSLLTGCQGDDAGAEQLEQRARTVIFDMATGRVDTPELYNPLVPGVVLQQGLPQALIEPLFIMNHESGETEPWLGERFESNDTLDVWTLVLREGIEWSDGEAFDADDVVFTINLLKDGPAELLNAAAIKEWVRSVKKVDALTVEFQLTKPNPRFQLDYFAVKITTSIPILPEHIWSGQDPLTFKNYDKEKGWPVFTGPYRPVTVSPTQFVYERRPDWWGAKAGFLPLPKPERLTWIVNETEEVRAARASDHQLDSMADISTGAFESIRARNEDIISWLEEKPYSWVDPCPRLLSFNNAAEPWADRDIRWAVNHAIDRDEVVKIAYEGATTPARFFFPTYPPLEKYVGLLEAEGLFDEYPITSFDPERTASILKSKGFTKSGEFYQRDGQELQLNIDTPAELTEIKRIAQVLVEQLRRAGINANLRALAFTTWAENNAHGKFQAVTDFSACASVSEPWSSMHIFHPKWVVPVGERANSNTVRWKNEEYGANLDRFGSLPLDDPRIEPFFVAAARAWLADLPFIPVAQAKKLVPFDTHYWTGWPTKEDNYLHPPTWWQSAHKIIHNLKPAER